MELRDIRTPFLRADAPTNQAYSIAPAWMRVALLSESSNVAMAVQRALMQDQVVLTRARSTTLVMKAIERNVCDVAIIDIERSDVWPDLVVSKFDEAATDCPIIMLCKNQRQVSNYLQKIQYVVDIYSYDALGDPRFSSVIQAAALRRDASRSNAQDGWHQTPLR